MILNAEIVRRLLDYNPSTGAFIWKAREETSHFVVTWNKRRAGKHAGRTKPNENGYLEIAIDSQLYAAHRLAWLYMTGEWPKDQIDHINLKKADNRFENLREATCAQNGWNVGFCKKNGTGFKGVYLYKPTGRYYCQFSVSGKRYYRGYFVTAEEAYAVYVSAITEHHGEFARVA